MCNFWINKKQSKKSISSTVTKLYTKFQNWYIPVWNNRYYPSWSEVPPTPDDEYDDDHPSVIILYVMFNITSTSDPNYHTLDNYVSKSRMNSQQCIRFFRAKIAVLTWCEYHNMDDFCNVLDHDFHDSSHTEVWGPGRIVGVLPIQSPWRSFHPVFEWWVQCSCRCSAGFLICGFGTFKLLPYSHLWVWDVLAVPMAPFLGFLWKFFICGQIVLFSHLWVWGVQIGALFSFVGLGLWDVHAFFFCTLFEFFLNFFICW